MNTTTTVSSASAAARLRFFFDSHGGLWKVCSPDEHGAMAFGPQWTARPAEDGERAFWWESLDDDPSWTPSSTSLYMETKKMGWHLEEGGWTYLV